jgi:hypothetical protein
LEKDEQNPNEIKTTQFSKGDLLLGFFSSCTIQPYRFQFIYLENYGEDAPLAKRAEDRTILENNC